MTRFKKVIMINQINPIIKYHLRSSDGRLFIDWIGNKHFRLTSESQKEANKLIDEVFMEVIEND